MSGPADLNAATVRVKPLRAMPTDELHKRIRERVEEKWPTDLWLLAAVKELARRRERAGGDG